MAQKFKIIYADPPWSYNDKLDPSRTLKYPTMSIEQIAALDVASLAADDCTLFVWATWPQLFDKFGNSPVGKIIHFWGFEFKTCGFVWVKVNKLTEVNQAAFFPADSFDVFWGGGHWTRANTEFCLLATRGHPKRVDASVHQVIYAPVGEHSRKPAETRTRIVKLMGDVARVELFARETVDGWHSWGNQVESTIQLADDEPLSEAEREEYKRLGAESDACAMSDMAHALPAAKQQRLIDLQRRLEYGKAKEG